MERNLDFDYTLGSNHMLVVDHRSLELLVVLHNLELVLGRSRHFNHTLVIVELLHNLMVGHKLVLVVVVEEHCRIQLGLQHCFEQLNYR